MDGMILSNIKRIPPQISHVLAWDRAQDPAVRGWLLITAQIIALQVTGPEACSSVHSATALQNVCVSVTG